MLMGGFTRCAGVPGTSSVPAPRSRRPAGWLALLIGLWLRPAGADSVLVFNEIMYNPPGANGDLEWVELHNQMAVDLDISGWSLAAGIDFTFPEGTIVKGWGFLLVAASPAALEASGGPA